MSREEKDILRHNHAFLVRSLDPGSVRASLHAEGLLTDYEYEEIKVERVTLAANELILSALKRRGPGFLKRFCDVLDQESVNSHITNKLRTTDT